MTTESDALKTVLELARLQRSIARDIDRHIGELHGLSSWDLEPMMELQRAAGRELLASDLAGTLELSTSELVRRLAPLERIGVVERVTGDAGVREMKFVLTESGAALLRDALPSGGEAAVVALERRWSAAELDQLSELLRGELKRVAVDRRLLRIEPRE